MNRAFDLTPIETPAARTRKILAEVCAEYGVTLEELAGPDSSRRFSIPRHEAIRRLHAAGRSMERIGAVLNRDRATIHYALDPERNIELRRERARKAKARAS